MALIIAHHIMLTGYGHWLPNDPRGSLSRELRVGKLAALGEIHFGRKQQQPTTQEIREFYRAAEKHLKYPVVWFDPAQRQAVGEAFGVAIAAEGLTC